MAIERFLQPRASSWMSNDGENVDIAMSTRIRLARNLNNFKFPYAYTEDEALKVDKEISAVLLDKGKELKHSFTHISIQETPQLEREVLVEKHLISPYLAKGTHSGSVLISENEELSIMVNEEDHLRIQSLQSGFHLQEAYQRANELDSLLEKHLSYAFHEKYGYLTSCPTNTGTGMRASVMLHLPALTMSHQITRIIPAISRLGMVVRGIYGEGSEALGNVYQISNQVTLGKSEYEILQDLENMTDQIIQQERRAREAILSNSPVVLEDRIYRSLGTLTNARLLTTEEAATCLSDVRLGIDLKMIEGMDMSILNELMVFMQPAFLQRYSDKPLQPKERDYARAKLFRDRLNNEDVTNNRGEDFA
ncbi:MULTISPECIES: protein arginine kinase [unclassified Planococcus (in: firmicutes)]|uniref:protein arginine kinase n=1 Tax=unclassified Planococcus (in: firmicutes) TaxID=2662419 RepID=UPI001F00D81E|nr:MULTISPECIES: protein arginine kinase [unclassified Planococcus (in: firmicutes)]UJF26997.1 protein arginine kinase [Planococcus sp. 107-1]GKW47673.1 protein-arginine kinase [Planococcus sp. NCCP-2050]